MARVVERRKGIPWALIVFVFLFLVSATVAVLKTMSDDERRLAGEKKDKDLELFTRGIPTAEMDPMLTAARQQGGKGVIRQLRDRQQPIIELMMGAGSRDTIETATAKARDILGRIPAAGTAEAPEASASVVAAFEGMAAQVKALTQKIAEKEADIKKESERVTAAQGELAKLQELRKTEGEEFKKETARLTAHNEEIDKKHAEERATMKKGFDDKIEQLNVDISKLQGELEKAKAQLRRKDGEIGILRKKLDDIIRPQRMRTVAFQSDGKVIQTKPEDNIVYINIGTKDRVVAGLTFSVYSGEKGMPQLRKDDGTIVEAEKLRGKAQIYVIQPYEKISMCRIDWVASAGDPIIAGDQVANLAFDAERTYRFVVVGDFDLFGAGTPQESDGEYVKQLIRKFRGEMTKDVDDQTDFLVIGTKPQDVAAAEGEETAQMTKVRQEKEKRRAEYDRIVGVAKVRDIPVLNTNEFLALVGFTAKSSLRRFGADQR